MIEDPRVKTKPGPAVYTLNLASSSVDIGGRCWVNNKDLLGGTLRSDGENQTAVR